MNSNLKMVLSKVKQKAAQAAQAFPEVRAVEDVGHVFNPTTVANTIAFNRNPNNTQARDYLANVNAPAPKQVAKDFAGTLFDVGTFGVGSKVEAAKPFAQFASRGVLPRFAAYTGLRAGEGGLVSGGQAAVQGDKPRDIAKQALIGAGASAAFNTVLSPRLVRQVGHELSYTPEGAPRMVAGHVQLPGKKGITPIHPDLLNSEAGAQTYEDIANAEAGKRYVTPEGTTLAQGSSFPKWVPEDLRRGPLFKQVQEHMINETTPKSGTKTGQLYDLVHEQIKARTSDKALPIENPQDPYYNVKRLGASPEGQQKVYNAVVGEAKPQIEAAVGKKLSHAEVMQHAQTASADISQAIGRDATLEIGAANLNLRKELARLADQPELTGDFIDALVADKSISTDTARLLAQRNIIADPTTAGGRLKIDYVKSILDVAKNKDDILKAAQGVDFNDSEQAAQFYRTFIQPNLGNWVDKLRYNSMLSSPMTHIKNIAGNVQGLVISPAEKTLTGGIDWLRAGVTGTARKNLASEGPRFAKGSLQALGEATHNFANVMRGATQSSAGFDARSIPLTRPGTLGRGLENTLDFTSKLLSASDEFFQALHKGGITQALEGSAAKGVKVGTIAQTAEAEAKYRLFNSEFADPHQGPVLHAIEAIPQAVSQLKQSKNPLVKFLADFTFPFVRVPTNILKQGVEYSPVGLATMWGAHNPSEQLAKAIMGTSIAVGTGSLLSSDRITWAEPASLKQKNAFRAAGMQPYAIKIGDTWYSYQYLHPAVSFNMALAAAWKNAHDTKRLNEDELDTVGQVAAKWVNFFADQSYVKNIGDFVSAAKGDETAATRYFSNYPQQLIPFRALLSWAERLTDPYQHQVDPTLGHLEKQVQQFAMQIPGLAEQTPLRTDELGQPIANQNRALNAFSPVKVTQENQQGKAHLDQLLTQSKAARELADLKGGKIPNGASADLGDGVHKLSNGKLAYDNGTGEIQTIDPAKYDSSYKSFKKLMEQTDLPDSVRTAIVDQAGFSSNYTDRYGYEQQKPEFDAEFALLKDRAKRGDNLPQWLHAAQTEVSFLESYRQTLDPQADRTDYLKVTNALEDITAEAEKYGAYGGFKKPLKPKLKKLPKAKKPNLKIANPSLATGGLKRQSRLSRKKGRAATVAVPIKQPRITGAQLAALR